jgi:tight adherence protein B
MSDIVVVVLVFFSVLFGVCGIWLLLRQRSDARSRISARLLGVKQIKRYELGDALAENRDREQRKKDSRKEAIRKQAFSDIPAVDKALKKITWADKLNGMLIQAQLPVSVANFVMLCCLLAVMGVALALLWRRHFDPLLSALFGLILGSVPAVYVYVKVHRRVRKFNRQLPDALDLLSSSVKAGQSLNSAVQNVADEMPDPIGDEFRVFADELTFGVTFDQALRNLMVRVHTPDVRFLCTALMIQKETGGNLSEVLDGLERTIRERFRILGQVKTLTAQGKLSGLIVGLLPVALCAFLYFANPAYMGKLFTDKFGHLLLAVAVGLQLTGGLMIRKIVNIKV